MITGLNKLSFTVFSWNIDGKHYILKNTKIENFINNYDILFIHETHCTKEMSINIKNYESFQHPCALSTPDSPRGGCIMFVKKHLMKHVKGIDKNFNDAIVMYMEHNLVICGFYIPPTNSKYYDDQLDIFETLTTHDRNRNVIVCGDLNSRLGNIDGLNGLSYTSNPDTEVNQHGRKMLDICKCNKLVPLNMLIKDTVNFDGDFTFTRSNLKSQNDWIMVSKDMTQSIETFNLLNDLSGISDHIPIAAKVNLTVSGTLQEVCDSLNEILSEQNNHSRYKKIKTESINMSTFQNVMNTYVNDIKNICNETDTVYPDMLAGKIEDSLRKAAKVSSNFNRPHLAASNLTDGDISYSDAIKRDCKIEFEKWKSVLDNNDPKSIWQKIDFNGKYNEKKVNSENTCNEFADFLEKRCTLPPQHCNYDGIESKIFDPKQDGAITEAEIISAAKNMNHKSAVRCGISVKLLIYEISE